MKSAILQNTSSRVRELLFGDQERVCVLAVAPNATVRHSPASEREGSVTQAEPETRLRQVGCTRHAEIFVRQWSAE